MEFKKYLRGVSDAGTLNSGQERMESWAGIEKGECLLCDAECESVSHVLWDCPSYASIRSAFIERSLEIGLNTFRVLIVLRCHLVCHVNRV